MRTADYRCDTHGLFEASASADADHMPCPTCSAPSPWSPSPVIGRIAVSATRGKSDRPPTKQAANTLSTIGEGQRYGEWRNDRRKMWSEYDEKRRRG